jgi:RNA-directed DNA polymerase
MVHGHADHLPALASRVERVIAAVGPRLSEAKTRSAHIDQGFDFLGFRIHRHTQWGSRRRYVYSYPSTKALAQVMGKIKASTDKQVTERDPMVVILELNRITRGWANYFRTGASKNAFTTVGHHLWWRIWRWLRAKHPTRNARWVRRVYYHHDLWWPTAGKYTPADLARTRIQRHAYRGNRIPTPWNAHTLAATV